jgi:hypothetical protein
MAAQTRTSGNDVVRIVRGPNDRRQPQPDVDQIEELVRIVGETNGNDPRRPAKGDKRASHPFAPSRIGWRRKDARSRVQVWDGMWDRRKLGFVSC